MLSKHVHINLLINNEEIFKNQLSYWKRQLTDAPPFLELATDKPRSSVISRGFSNFSFLIPKLASDALKNLSQKSGADLLSVVLAAFTTLLYRYTNQEDILVGYSNTNLISNVNESGKLVGGQVNKTILRTDLSGDPVFFDLIKRVHNTVREAGDHQSLPFDTILQSLRNEGILFDSIFQIVFEFGNATGSDGRHSTLTVNADIPTPDLYLSIEETNEGLSGTWRYNPDLFVESTINRIASHFQNLLLGIIADPHQNISRFLLLSTQERLQILFEWNNTAVEYPDNKCIHELFEEQVIRTPDAVAVHLYESEKTNAISAQKKLTYQQLNTRANQVAHYLRDLGVGPDVLVGICVKRSLEMMVGLMGILKAGGAYVPLDPGYPKERLQFMLKDSAVSVLLTQQQLREELPSNNTQVICLDSDWDKIARSSNKNLVSSVKPENLAYVIYTSGSTGIPKGTLIIHQGVVNYLNWCTKEYAVANGSGAPVNSSIAFDATVTSFFAPLLVGKRVMLLPESEEIEALSTVLLSGNHFSLVKITPAHLEILRHSLPPDQIKNQVNALVIGGEVLLSKSLDLWRTHTPDTRLINEYGPTETVVGCCTYEVSNKNALLSEEVPIGRPIANMQMYILDRHMEPVPIGVSGEIYIGGAGLARGYLNRPDLTEQRFVSNPFTDDTNVRLYKSGDLARYLNDGNIVFQGRIDHQVKIRGYRIELGEIESTLAKHASIQHVTVIAREDHPGDKRLVAYIVVKDQTPSVNDLRLFIGEKLPEYMVPAVFVFLKSLPLTSNGKVDRAALPVPGQQSTGSEKSHMPPRDSTEQKLAEIFQNCLNIQRIGVTDDFFELGGNSIQAAIIFSQIRKTLDKQLPLSTLIHSSTIEKLAIVIRGEKQEPDWSCLVPIQPKGSRPPLFCVHGGWGNVLFYRHLSKHLGSDQPLYGLQPKGLNGNDDPYYKLEEMAAHYIREIRSVQPKGPYYLAGYCFGAIAAYEMAQQLVRAGEKIAFLGSFNGVSPTYNQPPKVNHFETFKTLRAKDKMFYPVRVLRQNLKRKIVFGKFHMQVKIRALCYKFYFIQGRALTESLRRFYIVDAMLIAQKAYSPEQYPGQMTIFRSPQIFRNPHLGWSSLVPGRIKTFDIPGKHSNRTRIMYEPFVEFLAKELKNQFEKISPDGVQKISKPGKASQTPISIHQSDPKPVKTFVGPSNSIELQLTKIFEKTLNTSSIGVHDDFFELGGGSRQAAALFSKIRKRFRKNLPFATLIQASTVHKLAAILREKLEIGSWSSLVHIQTKGTKSPLFCIHAGAGTVFFYRDLSQHLGLDQPLYGLQAKGIDGNETPHTRIEDMAAHYIFEIRKVQPHGPYYLSGYCLGAIIAFEMAHQFIKAGDKVAFLGSFNGVSSTYKPPRGSLIINDDEDKPPGNSNANPTEVLKTKKRLGVFDIRGRMVYTYKILKRIILPRLRKIAYRFYIKSGRPLPEALGKIYFLETNGRMAKAYSPNTYPGKLIIFRSPQIYKNPYLGWDGLASEGIETCDISGHHENRREIMNEPFVGSLAEKLKKYLE